MKFFRLKILKHFVEEPLCVSESFQYRKGLEIKKGRSTIFFRLFFVARGTDCFRRRTAEPLKTLLRPFIEKIMHRKV